MGVRRRVAFCAVSCNKRPATCRPNICFNPLLFVTCRAARCSAELVKRLKDKNLVFGLLIAPRMDTESRVTWREMRWEGRFGSLLVSARQARRSGVSLRLRSSGDHGHPGRGFRGMHLCRTTLEPTQLCENLPSENPLPLHHSTERKRPRLRTRPHLNCTFCDRV